MFFSSSLKEGAWTSFNFANKIFQFPVGLVLSAVLVPLFPIFSRLIGQKDFKGVENYFIKGLGSLILIGTYLMVLIFIIRTDAISVALERGAFTHEATLMVSEILFFISISIIPYVIRDSATRLYYSFNDSKTPFFIAIGCIALKVILNLILVKPFGINGIAMSTSLITLFNATCLTLLLKKKIKMNFKNLIVNSLKVVVIGIITYIIGNYCSIIWDKFVEANLYLKTAKIVLIIGITGIIFIIGSLILKVEYLTELKERILNRWKKN